MTVAVSRRHREQRSTIAVTSCRNHRVIHPRYSYASVTLYLILSRSVRSRYDLAMTIALPRRLCNLGIANLGASAMLPQRSKLSGQLQVWFKCSPKVGVRLLDSRTNSERFHSHEIEEWRAIFHLHCSY